jgi:putative membrane protein
MFDGLCHPEAWGFLGDFGVWGWIGLILNLVFWVGLIAGFVLLVLWAIRRGPIGAASVPFASGQPTAMETLRARYARGEIKREQYELLKQDIS